MNEYTLLYRADGLNVDHSDELIVATWPEREVWRVIAGLMGSVTVSIAVWEGLGTDAARFVAEVTLGQD